MDEKEEKLYRQMEKDMLLPFEDGDVDAVNAAALSGKDVYKRQELRMGEVGYKTLAIDIETFSDVDLIKCGVYALSLIHICIQQWMVSRYLQKVRSHSSSLYFLLD